MVKEKYTDMKAMLHKIENIEFNILNGKSKLSRNSKAFK